MCTFKLAMKELPKYMQRSLDTFYYAKQVQNQSMLNSNYACLTGYQVIPRNLIWKALEIAFTTDNIKEVNT